MKEFLRRHEGKTLEFKENTKSLRGILKSVVAFANTAGGTIVIGIRDKSKDIIGLANPLLEEERISNAISDSIQPLIVPDIEISTYRNKELLIIRVPHLAGPCFLKQEGNEKGVYIRFGSTNRKTDAATLHALRLFASNTTFDELASIHGKIDEHYLQSVFRSVKKQPTKKQYQTLGIYTDHSGKMLPSIGGLLLFSQNRHEIFPDSIIRCACFQDKTKEQIIDSIDILAPLPTAVDEILTFINKNSRKETKIGKSKSVEIPEYPPGAVRELIINALLHSDYSMKGSHIQIALFSDRLEITNPGSLTFGQTLEKALSGYSRLRNHVIGRVFRVLGLIEQWGSGLQRISAICEKQGLRPPLFLEEENHFRAVLYSKIEKKITRYKYEEQILAYLKKHETIQTKEAAKMWNISDRATRTRLSKLVAEGVLVRVSTSEKDPQAVYVLKN